MRFISWNIDSLNAALTSDSNRAVLTSKKHVERLGEFFKGYAYSWRTSRELARKGYAGTMFLYKDRYSPELSYPQGNGCLRY